MILTPPNTARGAAGALEAIVDSGVVRSGILRNARSADARGIAEDAEGCTALVQPPAMAAMSANATNERRRSVATDDLLLLNIGNHADKSKPMRYTVIHSSRYWIYARSGGA